MFHAGFPAKNHVPCRISLQQILCPVCVQDLHLEKYVLCKIFFKKNTPYTYKEPFFKRAYSENIFSENLQLEEKIFGEWSSTVHL
jgi:hypothetical protein